MREWMFKLLCCLEPIDKTGEIENFLDAHKDIPSIEDMKTMAEKFLDEEKNRNK
jgi:hypothetical protein